MRRLAVCIAVVLGFCYQVPAAADREPSDAPPTDIDVNDGTLEVVARQVASTSWPAVQEGGAAPAWTTGLPIIECWLFLGEDLAVDDPEFYDQYSVYDLLSPISIPVAGSRYFRWCKVNGLWEPSSTLGASPPPGTVSRWIVYTPSDPLGGDLVTATDAVEVVLDAIAGDLVIEEIDTSPPATVEVPLGVDVWLWLPESEYAEIGPLTAQAGAVWATAWATPREIEWDMGDGTTVVCDDETNVAYDPDRSYESQADLDHCGHVYDDPPDGDTYPVSATVTWGIDIATNLNPVRRPFIAATETTSPTVDLPVVEIQAVIR